MPTYYEILGVASDASIEDIRKAFRHQARLRHPDTAAGSQAAMVELNEAYETLKDPQQRRDYDRSLRGGMRRPVPRAPRSTVEVVDPLVFLLRVFKPVDLAVEKAVTNLEKAVEELAYDLYDDRYVAAFEAAVRQASAAIAEAVWTLRRSRWPGQWDSALHLYSQGMRQIEDALEDFEVFPLNYDSDLIVLGREVMRGGVRLVSEARARMGLA